MSNFPYRYRFRAKPLNNIIPSINAVLVGDSLTALSYGPLHPFNWTNGIAGGRLKFVANSSIANNTIQDVINRIDNSYLNASPGISGITGLGWTLLRIGTNNFRGGASIGTSTQNQYIELFSKILTYSEHCIVFAVPPVGTTGVSDGWGIPSVNAWLASYCSGNPRLHFINDCINVDDGNGNWVSGYASGETPAVHFTNQASYRMGIDGGSVLDTLLSTYSYVSPISLNSLDVYPTVDQWVLNHRMTGTGGTNYIGSGSVPDNWAIGGGGAGHTATSSIVSADIGDSNQAPWLRLTPTSIGNSNSWIGMGPAVSHDAVTTLYPDALDIAFELRFNNFDGTKFKGIHFFMYGSSNEQVSPESWLRMGEGPINSTVVFRTAINRSSTRSAHDTVVPDFRLEPVDTYSGSMGSIDIRCMTIRSY